MEQTGPGGRRSPHGMSGGSHRWALLDGDMKLTNYGFSRLVEKRRAKFALDEAIAAGYGEVESVGVVNPNDSEFDEGELVPTDVEEDGYWLKFVGSNGRDDGSRTWVPSERIKLPEDLKEKFAKLRAAEAVARTCDAGSSGEVDLGVKRPPRGRSDGTDGALASGGVAPCVVPSGKSADTAI